MRSPRVYFSQCLTSSQATCVHIFVLWSKCNCICAQYALIYDGWWNSQCQFSGDLKDLSNVFIAFINKHACKSHTFCRPVLWRNLVPLALGPFPKWITTKNKSTWNEMNPNTNNIWPNSHVLVSWTGLNYLEYDYIWSHLLKYIQDWIICSRLIWQ